MNAAPRLAKPSATNSWLPSTLSRRRAARDWATAKLSRKPTREIASTVGKSFEASVPIPVPASDGSPSSGRPAGMLPTTVSPQRWSSANTEAARVPTATTRSGAARGSSARAQADTCGRRSIQRPVTRGWRKSTSTASPPTSSVVTLVSPTREASRTIVSHGTSPRGAGTPRSGATWLEAMTSAAALVKPETTGCEMKLTRKPARRSPMPSCTTPTATARSAATPMASAGSSGPSSASPPATSKETTATGPTAR